MMRKMIDRRPLCCLFRQNLYDNKVSDVRVLNQLPHLKEVNLAGNNIDKKLVAEQLEKPGIAVFMYRPHVPFLIEFDSFRDEV